MPRETVDPTPGRDEGWEQHPAWALIGASRWSGGNDVLFDSDIRHQNTVVVTLQTAERKRELSHDWIHPDKQIIQVQMSEAQWASFVSSMSVGNGVPCTLRFREGAEEMIVPAMPYAPRLQQSMDEVRAAGDKAMEKIREAYEVALEKPTKANLRDLGFAIQHAAPNMEFAAKSLNEHAENVVQRARADLEAMVLAKAQQLGIDPAELGTMQLEAGEVGTDVGGD